MLKALLKKAMTYHENGQLKIADELYTDVLEYDHDNPDALHLKGVIAFQQGRYGESAELISRAIQKDNKQAAFFNNLGNTLNSSGQLTGAAACFKKALSIDPEMADAVFNLANVRQRQGDFDKAIKHYHEAIQLKEKRADIYNNLGIAYYAKGMTQNAEESYRNAIEIDPYFVDAYNNLCALQEGTSQLENALETALAAFEIDPGSSFALYNLAQVFYRLQRYPEADKLLKEHIEMNLPDTFYARFCFLLGKVNNRMNRYNDAFGYFTKANQSILSSDDVASYRRKNLQTLGQIDETRRFFSASRISRWRFPPVPKENIKRAFLVGFPRSGTTLLEQILTTNERVATIDEQPIFEEVFRQFRLPDGGLAQLDHLSSHAFYHHRQRYLDRSLDKIRPSDSIRLIVDKLPLNILYLGVIYRFFPDAKIIVALRHPLGCVLSSFMQQFKLNKMMFNFLSIEGSAKLYAAVMRLYLNYREILPIPMHQIRYEDIVGNLEHETRKLFSFLDLEWQGAVLNFHKAARNRKISTPSYSQVVKPIYQDAANRWQKYETHLAPAMKWVEPFIQSFGYGQRHPDPVENKSN